MKSKKPHKLYFRTGIGFQPLLGGLGDSRTMAKKYDASNVPLPDRMKSMQCIDVDR